MKKIILPSIIVIMAFSLGVATQIHPSKASQAYGTITVSKDPGPVVQETPTPQTPIPAPAVTPDTAALPTPKEATPEPSPVISPTPVLNTATKPSLDTTPSPKTVYDDGRGTATTWTVPSN